MNITHSHFRGVDNSKELIPLPFSLKYFLKQQEIFLQAHHSDKNITMEFDTALLQQAANEARGLAIDAVHQCSSGHLGLPLGCAETGAVLFGHCLEYNPENPRWWNRDRFILSAGHGSMFLYAWLHLGGYDLSLDDIKNFRALHSKTPGHPEYGDTPGIECTTGPLGQGVGNAVGMAVSGKMLQERFNTDDTPLFDYRVFCLAGDGCLQEGVAREAVAFAGHQGLDNLILLYDCNLVTLDAQADETQSEDTKAVYEGLGWEVNEVDGHDMQAVRDSLRNARSRENGKPKLIILKTEVGRSIPEVAGTWKAHGEGGAEFAEPARKRLGLPDEPFYVSDSVRSHFRVRAEEGKANNEAWDHRYAEWKKNHSQLAQVLEDGFSRKQSDPETILQHIPEFDDDDKIATRAAGGKILNALAKQLPLIVSGSADLHGSTKNYIEDAGGDFSRENRAGRNIRFGIREHAMGAIVNGMGYDGLFIPSGATFFTFSDYMRASVRLSALAGLPVTWYWTHDSVGVGEDGPTHQPVEHLAACRAIPNLNVFRPGDPEETAGALAAAIARSDGPTALVLSRQKIPTLNKIPLRDRRLGTLKGAYIAAKESGELKLILLASGSELHKAMEAASKLGEGVRVVSMPCMERFNEQDENYKAEILPPECRARIAMEAGVDQPWYQYVGLEGKVVSIQRFGLSAPGDQVMEELGISVKHLCEVAKSMLRQ